MSQNWTPPPPPTAPAAVVPNNMVLAIIAAVVSFFFCCLPHGLISVLFASKVNSKAMAGDVAGAGAAAKNAKLWAFISIGVAIVWFVISIAFGVLGGILSAINQPR